MRPAEDIEIARRRRLRWWVKNKAARGARWELVMATDDLDSALERARAESEYETGVFLETEYGGLFYWSSKAPEVYNSTVLTMEIV